MSGRATLADIHPRCRGQVEALLAAQRSSHPLARPALVIEAPLSERRVRQSHKPRLNKLETEFADILRVEFAGVRVYDQSFRVEMANGHWYKVDFWIPARDIAFEVKGPKAFRGGFENLKDAASKYPDITWVLAWKQAGQWYRQTMIP